MTRAPEDLEAKVEGLPDAPGVYLWKGERGEVLYVGKAKSLRSRVRSYLVGEQGGEARLELLRREIADLETIVVASEAQALLLENNLIKEYRPRHNITLRDDKRYPWIAVTLNEPFPRVLVTRQMQGGGARYFGPYTDVGALRHTLRVIRRLFAVRTCSYELPADPPDRPCLEYHIQKCKAPCVGLQSPAAYGRMIEDVVLFLEGRTLDVRRRLRERMQEASRGLDFEEAAELRDTLARLTQIEEPTTVERVGGGDCDVVGLARDDDDACGVSVRVRGGKVLGRVHHFLEGVAGRAEDEILTAYLVRCYLPSEDRSRRCYLPAVPADLEALTQLDPQARWSVARRGLGRRLADLADQNARHLLETLRLETFEGVERTEDPVYAVGRDLGMTVVPRRMVGVDVSTAQGRDTVGAIVWFENGRPKRSEYRTYRVKTVGGPDDLAAIGEVVERFLRRRILEGRPLPNLLLVDGGRGQLAAAQSAAQASGASGVALASLAKREEEVFLPGRPEPLRLSRRSPALQLLQRARDEAHRCALGFNRRRRTARTMTSELLSIPMIGERRRGALLRQFGSLAGVRHASREEIAAVPGFSSRLAEQVLAHLGGGGA